VLRHAHITNRKGKKLRKYRYFKAESPKKLEKCVNKSFISENMPISSINLLDGTIEENGGQSECAHWNANAWIARLNLNFDDEVECSRHADTLMVQIQLLRYSKNKDWMLCWRGRKVQWVCNYDPRVMLFLRGFEKNGSNKCQNIPYVKGIQDIGEVPRKRSDLVVR